MIKSLPLTGISRTPDGTICPDGELSMAMNVVNDGQGIRLAEKPVTVFDLEDDETALLIDKVTAPSQDTHYILAKGANSLVWVSGNDTAHVRNTITSKTTTADIDNVDIIGNTIIVNHKGKGIEYFLWSGEKSKYSALGNKPPMPNFEFALRSDFLCWPDEPNKGETYNGISFQVSADDIGTLPYWGNGVDNGWADPAGAYADGTAITPHDTWKYTFSMENYGNSDAVAGAINRATQYGMAAINSFIAKHGTEKNRFTMPFYVRYAYEMYDGTYMMHSYPVLMMPSSRGPVFCLDGAVGLQAYKEDGKWKASFRGRAWGFVADLVFRLTGWSGDSSLSEWKDLIKNVSIFITPPIYAIDQSGQVYGWTNMDLEGPENPSKTADGDPYNKHYSISCKSSDVGTENESYTVRSFLKALFENMGTVIQTTYTRKNTHTLFSPYAVGAIWPGNTSAAGYKYSRPSYVLTIPHKSDDEFRDLMIKSMQFFRAATIDFDDLAAMTPQSSFKKLDMDDGTLNTIVNRQQLDDDFHSHDVTESSVSFVYNRRLNLGAVTRHMHAPLPYTAQLCRWDGNTAPAVGSISASVSVYVKCNGVSKVMAGETGIIGKYTAGTPNALFLFYPDTNAYKAVITLSDIDGGTLLCKSVKLEEHPQLNGSYWLGNINAPAKADGFSSATPPAADGDAVTDESGKVLTSNVDNPFGFAAENTNTIGDGSILALAAATQAMSEGQFGTFPMYCFTTAGVWAMQVSSSGGWASAQPITRDVMTSGTKPLSLDAAVVFLTQRGLVYLNGSSAKTVTDKLTGFDTWSIPSLKIIVPTDTLSLAEQGLNVFPTKAAMTYDYEHQRVYISPYNINGSWVWNLVTQMWTQTETAVSTHLNSFPDCTFVSQNKVMTLTQDRTDGSGNPATQRYSNGYILTRPAKLGTEGLRKVREMIARGFFKPYGGSIKTALLGSRNWNGWLCIASSNNERISRTGGSPMLAHRILCLIDTQSQTDAETSAITGLELDISQEQANKLR